MIRFDAVSCSTGSFSLNDLSFAVPSGTYAVLMGKTGQGKTTILEMLCGLRHHSSGEIWIGDRDVSRLSPADRRVAYVPQDLALFPTMNVYQHLEFAPRLQKMKRLERDRLIETLAKQLGITHLLQRSVRWLSGGESQRVALGRALAARPLALLLDEPLSALDDQTRSEMYQLLKSITSENQVTTLHVTHNLEEAKQLGELHLQLKDGQVIELPGSVPKVARTSVAE